MWTKAQQQTSLGEGLALGAIMVGIGSVNGNKMRLELDFRRAWRTWPYRELFPAIRTGPAIDDVLHVLKDAPSRRSQKVASWEGAWPFIPVLRFDDWSAAEVAEVIDDRLPAEAWADLTRSWLSSNR